MRNLNEVRGIQKRTPGPCSVAIFPDGPPRMTRKSQMAAYGGLLRAHWLLHPDRALLCGGNRGYMLTLTCSRARGAHGPLEATVRPDYDVQRTKGAAEAQRGAGPAEVREGFLVEGPVSFARGRGQGRRRPTEGQQRQRHRGGREGRGDTATCFQSRGRSPGRRQHPRRENSEVDGGLRGVGVLPLLCQRLRQWPGSQGAASHGALIRQGGSSELGGVLREGQLLMVSPAPSSP